ncbi:ribonuclease R [Parvularcula sp. IMCC14364]|uniref:ribonuclease R n=1 Tax=Parvularcula sp. IMCC14364 TaxID=3067902 RepID=UPI0027422863|nr:ribonuclease R [Parvularcula sp. IMCC14364]
MPPLPSKKEIRDFIEKAQQQGGEVSRREIARAFNVKGEARTELRQLLKQMSSEGLIDQKGKRATARGSLPPVAVLDILDTDDEGDLICFPPNWKENFAPPPITLPADAAAKTRPVLGRGDRFLGRLAQETDGTYTAKPIKHIGQGAERILGVYRDRKVGGAIEPVSRKAKRDYLVEPADINGATDGDLVWAEAKNQRGYGPRMARIREVLGDISNPASYSQIAIANHDIRTEFPAAVHGQADAATTPDIGSRTDLRETPLITIDPADARDHDDAVFAEPDPDPKNEGGWRVIVAITDVAWFVSPGSDLDKEALKRGNSTYLPDMVVPMLPERLSNDLCSLKEGVDRPALATEMIFDSQGRKRQHKFIRIMMKSHAGLSYTQVQNGIDGNPDEQTAPLMENVIKPLWAAYRSLCQARNKRGPLDLDMPERRIIFDDAGHVEAVATKERFEANRLIEEFMIQANVAAAETLKSANLPAIYRVHGEPDPERLDGAREFLESMGYSLPKGQVLKSENLNQILKHAREKDEVSLVSQIILRAQRQAVYDTSNIGHFGLNLRNYAHFTSPIRRYADITVHRGLIRACNLEKKLPPAIEQKELQQIAEDVSDLERKSMAAERESTDRFLASWLSDRVGAEFAARINGVTRSGLFVTLEDTGADGFIPARTIGAEYFRHEESANALVSEAGNGIYRMGQPVQVRLKEVTPLQGGLLFEMLSEPLTGIKITKGKGRATVGKKSVRRKTRSENKSSSKRKRK